MLEKYWLKERGSDSGGGPACFCPYEPPRTVVVGMSYISDAPPRGECVGEFFYQEDDNSIGIELYEGVEIKIVRPS